MPDTSAMTGSEDCFPWEKRVCGWPGSNPVSRVAVPRASPKDTGHNGICAIRPARRSIVAARGKRLQRAASAHGSNPERARADRIVSVDPFNSVPTSLRKKASRPVLVRAKTSGRAIILSPWPRCHHAGTSFRPPPSAWRLARSATRDPQEPVRNSGSWYRPWWSGSGWSNRAP
jgi:hypothetical protein